MAAEDDRVRGMGETVKQAEAGMALFAKEDEVERDVEAATAFKEEHEAAVKAKEDEANALTGKDNKKAKQEKSKEASAMKNEPKYIDACKVLKGLDAPNGNFMTKKKAAAPVAEKKEDAPKEEEKKKDEKKDDKKPAKKVESAGISKAERDELEKLKTDLIKRKSDLKAEGKSGGECNKDEQVVAWVARMQELKIKEDPSAAAGGKKDDKKKDDKKKVDKSGEKMELEAKIEEYRMQLKQEFKYSDKDIKADPDMMEMQKQFAKMK